MNFTNKKLVILGYSTTLLTALYATLKFQKLPGPHVIMLIAGLFMSVYFPLIFLKQFKNKTNKEPRMVHKFGAILLGMIIISIILNFQHWSIVMFEQNKIITYLTIHPLIFNAAYFGFSLIFIPWLIYDNYKIKKEGLLNTIVGGTGLAIISLGLIGNQMHLPFWTHFLSVGNGVFILIYLPLYMRTMKKNPDKLDSMFQFLITVYIITIFVYCTFMGLPPTYQDVILRGTQ